MGFSIGLFQTFAHPEVIVFGLPFEQCMDVVNGIGQQVRHGTRYDTAHLYENILNDPYKCAFREVQHRHYHDYIGYALWFYEDDQFPLLQCFWPDKANHLPWDKRCSKYVRSAQPLLYAP